ncbi:two pore domain potassium channel family protein [Micromonospora sp. 15K316]|uniref:potassium channel family protein n=1 Tax=Micromonospora sp. 15K316 TaxID=2530376 RepID=UPI001050093E|nr:potassium channel family protein [Micromonospora sp. 15K316]TDC29481.1 two pore domain potassium channel family protein [Micromonospora sp. 15K316]
MRTGGAPAGTPAPRCAVGAVFPGTGRRAAVDALYFALATLTTSGYGDLSAPGQFGRAFVRPQMVFGVGVLTDGP